MIKHIIFDFDGTIADSGEIGLQIINEFAEKYNYRKFTMTEVRAMSTIPVRERLKKVGVPLHKIPQISVEALVKYRRLMHSLKSFDGIREMLESLKGEGLYLAIISSNSAENIKEFLQNNNLGLFDRVVAVKNFFGKHRSLGHYLKEARLKPEEAIYIGDELRDVEACKKAGVKIIAVTWGFDSRELLQRGNPDFIADRPGDIMPIVKSVIAEERER
jgi:phosphoglycolate phosphatase